MNFCLSVVTAVKRKRHNITLYLHWVACCSLLML
jgi:hypothetical protein